MDFKVTTRRADSVLVVELAGRFTAGEALASLRQTIRDEVAKGTTGFCSISKMFPMWTAAVWVN